jgi:hypothetical protein
MPSPEDCGLLIGLRDGVEASRREVERKWGAYRLERLAGLEAIELLARFRRQQASWSTVLQAAWDAGILTADLLASVKAKAAAMQRGWQALDAWASEAGHRAIAPWVWEVPLADGSIAALVEDDEGAAKVIADGRYVSVYTVREIGTLIDAVPNALKLAKIHWPGAKFQAAAIGNPLGAPEWSDAGDPIPFGEPVQ